MLDSESESDRSRIDNGERTKGERFQYNRFTPSDTSSTVYNMETTSSTLSERGKMPIPQRATLFFKSLPIDGEDASSEHDKIKGRPPKLLKEIPKSAFQYYQIRINEKPNKVRPDLLELRSKYLTEVTGIDKYFHVYYLDLTYNKIPNEGLSAIKNMQNLVTLVLDHNKLLSTTIPTLRNLEYLSINRNLLKKIDPFYQPKLMHVFLNENKIKRIRNVDANSLPSLYTLSICKCKLTSMVADYAPSLRRLYLSNNNITKIQGISHLVNLEVLHLRANRIYTLSGLSSTLKKLFYINLRDNEIEEKKELKKIKRLPMLRIFIVSENPIEGELGYDLRNEILLQIPDMRRINKFIVNDEEELMARELIQLKQAEEERKRLRRERLRELGEMDAGEYGEDEFEEYD